MTSLSTEELISLLRLLSVRLISLPADLFVIVWLTEMSSQDDKQSLESAEAQFNRAFSKQDQFKVGCTLCTLLQDRLLTKTQVKTPIFSLPIPHMFLFAASNISVDPHRRVPRRTERSQPFPSVLPRSSRSKRRRRREAIHRSITHRFFVQSRGKPRFIYLFIRNIPGLN